MQSTLTRTIVLIALGCSLTSPAFALSPFAGTPAPWPQAEMTDTEDDSVTVSTKDLTETHTPPEHSSR